MQFFRAIGAAALLLLVGTSVPAHPQQNRQNDKQGKAGKEQGKEQRAARPSAQKQRSQDQPQQPQARGQQQRNEPQERERAQPAQQQRRAQQQQGQRPQQARQQQPQRTRQQATAWQQKRGWVQQGAWREHSNWQQSRAQRWEEDHRTWAQRGGYGGYYIPQARFSVYFGSQHWFRMRSRPTIYMGFPRFSYGGFSFLLVDPWPEYWADNWYDTDDVYVDYDDGYYLFNRRHPGIRLAITVVL